MLRAGQPARPRSPGGSMKIYEIQVRIFKCSCRMFKWIGFRMFKWPGRPRKTFPEVCLKYLFVSFYSPYIYNIYIYIIYIYIFHNSHVVSYRINIWLFVYIYSYIKWIALLQSQSEDLEAASYTTPPMLGDKRRPGTYIDLYGGRFKMCVCGHPILTHIHVCGNVMNE
jgi:hypothetical protein